MAKTPLVRILLWVVVGFLQLIMSQVVTFIASMLFPGLESVQQSQPILFAGLLSVSFSLGVFLTGWLALKWNWLKARSRYGWRLVGTLMGASLPLIIALLIYPTLEPGNPFFFISMLGSILGFHLPGWVKRR